jgi:tetratricopeptide (TPR) repeat protein
MADLRADIDALLREAEAGGPKAGLAARRAAWLAEPVDPDKALAALELAARLEPFHAGPRLDLSRLHAEAGHLDAARREAETVLADAVDQAARARASFILGELARARGAPHEARAAYRTVIDIEEALLKTDRTNPHAARWLARARGRIADLDAGAGDFARAHTGAEGALALLKAAAAQISETPPLAADIADAELRLGALELDAGQADSARRRFAQAIGRYEALILVEPKEPHWRGVLADAWALAAEAEYVRAQPALARAAMDKAIALRTKLASADKAERWALAGLWRVRAALLSALKDEGGAAHSLQHARALAEQQCGEAQGAEAPARFLVNTLIEQADHALRANAPGAAKDAANDAREIAEAFARTPKSDPAWRADLAACWDRIGEAARALRAAPADAFARAVEFRRMHHEAAPSGVTQRALAASLLKSGDVSFDGGELRTAHAAYAEAAALRLRRAENTPGDIGAAHELAVALERVGLAAAALGDRDGARAAWEGELSLAAQLFPDSQSVAAHRFCAIVEAHLSTLGGLDAAGFRADALDRLDLIAQAGALTERDTALRKKLWSA